MDIVMEIAPAADSNELTKLTNFAKMSDEYNFSKTLNLFDFLSKLYAPIIKKLTGGWNRTKSCPVDVFARRFGIKSMDHFVPLNEIIEQGCNFVLAGGKVVDWMNNVPCSKSFNDYDLWFLDQESWDMANEYFEKLFKPECTNRRTLTKHHVIEYFIKEDSYTWKFQLVRSKYGSIEELLTDFDFSCCAIGYDGERIYFAAHTLRDIREKRMRFQSFRECRNSFVRIEKYQKKGYFIKHGDYAIAALEMLGGMKNNEFSQRLFLNRENEIVTIDVNSPYYPEGTDPDERWRLKDEVFPYPAIPAAVEDITDPTYQDWTDALNANWADGLLATVDRRNMEANTYNFGVVRA
jgi:hypothetical protein